MEVKESLFLAAPFFMARTPFRPFDDFLKLLETNEIESELLALHSKDSLIHEALAIASSSLFEMLRRKKRE